jgi:hypothetical protein
VRFSAGSVVMDKDKLGVRCVNGSAIYTIATLEA